MGRLTRNPWLVVLALAAVALALWVRSTRTQDHSVRVAFDSAILITSGLDVQLNGLDVGKVGDVDYEDGHAVVTLGIDDGQAWPLPRGTKAAIRFGSTIGSGTRRIDLLPGPANAPPLPDGGLIGRDESIEAVEFDQLFNTFRKQTRLHAQSLAGRSARVLDGRVPELRAGLRNSAGAFDALDGLLGDLAEQRRALRRLTPVSARVVDTLAPRADRIQAVVLTAGETMRTFAERSREVRSSLELLPGTLAETRTTLRRLDDSAESLTGLLGDLRPGADRLSDLAPPLRDALVELRATVPAALRTVDVVHEAAPPTGAFLDDATPFLAEEVGPTVQRATPMLECVAPYAPELAGFVSTWAGFSKNYDAMGHYGRFHILEGPTSITGHAGDPGLLVGADPRIVYARARPPGFSAGQPRFIQSCGYTPALLDPSIDGEAAP